MKYEAFKYPGTEHGFNNDTTPRYDPAAAKLAWQRTIAFFNRKLRGRHGGRGSPRSTTKAMNRPRSSTARTTCF